MADANFLLGHPNADVGPANAYWDVGTGGTNLFLGGFDSLVWRISEETTDLVFSQYGTSPADKAVTGTSVEIELGLAQATPERLAEVMSGFTVSYDTNGNPVGYMFASTVGQRHSDIWKQMRLTRVVGQVESSHPMDTAIVWRAAPTVNLELTYDASSQRFARFTFTCYMDPDHLDDKGRPTFFGGGASI